MIDAALPDPVDFVAAALASRGALVERDAEEALALVPPDVARALGLPEEARLSTAADAPGRQSCGLGGPLLERLVAEARSHPVIAHVELREDAPRAEQALAAAGRFVTRNGVCDVLGTQPGSATYVMATMAYVAEADDRYEGLVEVLFDAATGACPDVVLAERLDVRRPDARRSRARDPLLISDHAAAMLVARCQHQLRGRLGPVLESVARRQAREHARIVEYFEAMIAEAAAPRRSVGREAIAAKIERLGAERDAKLCDLGPRYALRVTFAPAAIVLARVRVARVQLRLRRRKGSRELELQVPPGARTVDAVACEGCPGVTLRPVLCDDALHLLCERCAPSAEGRPRCAACRPSLPSGSR